MHKGEFNKCNIYVQWEMREKWHTLPNLMSQVNMLYLEDATFDFIR